jgi:hypothetical protein
MQKLVQTTELNLSRMFFWFKYLLRFRFIAKNTHEYVNNTTRLHCVRDCNKIATRFLINWYAEKAECFVGM